MITLTVNQLIYLLSLLPNVHEAIRREKYVIELMIPDDVFSNKTITQYEQQGHSDINKRVLSDVKKIQFRLNINTAYPTWEPTTDLMIKGQRNEKVR